MASTKISENHQTKGLQLNFNKLNQILATSDEHATHNHPQPADLLPLKPALNLHQPQQQQHQPLKAQLPKSLANAAFDENFGLVPLKPVASQFAKGCREGSPKEPSPPKLKSYSRNILSLQPQRASLAPQPLGQHTTKYQENPQNPPLANKENPELPAINLKHLQPPQQPQQESIISRIPRLSLKFPLSLLNNNQQQQRDSVKQTNNLTRLAPLAELQVETQQEEEIEDIDKSVSRDAIFMVCDIAKDIYDYMYQLEEAQSIKQDHLKDQKIFTPKVRQRLTNWCIEIHSQLKLLPETLYMTIAVIDRYMDQVQVKQQSQVQLVAVGATLIASKYEEIYPPDVGDLMHLTQNSYTRREIMRVEIQILEQLNFDLGKPIPLAFLRRFSRAAHSDQKTHAIAKYLMELSLAEYECSQWRPSMLAAAALYTTIQLTTQAPSLSPLFGSITRRAPVSQRQIQHDNWTKSLVHHTRYTSKQLIEPAAILCKVLKRSQKNPQSYACVKKNMAHLAKWPELKSAKVDELIKLCEHNQI